MAKATITESGLGVKLFLSFDEAAALLALLCRIGDKTDKEINWATLGVYDALFDVQAGVKRENPDLWPRRYDEFRSRLTELVDPDNV